MASTGSTEVMTTKELADYWGVSPQSVRHAAWQGDIPGCSKRGRGYVFDREVTLKGWKPSSVAMWERQARKPSLEGVAAVQEAAERYALALQAAVSLPDWTTIIVKAVEQAKEGDYRARQWLGNYLMGMPIQRVAAQVDVTTHRAFDEAERAAAIMVLLQHARERAEEGTTVAPQMTEG